MGICLYNGHTCTAGNVLFDYPTPCPLIFLSQLSPLLNVWGTNLPTATLLPHLMFTMAFQELMIFLIIYILDMPLGECAQSLDKAAKSTYLVLFLF